MTKKAIITTHDGREATIVTKASNVLFEDGQTAQDILNDRQDTMITPTITTSTSMSKVGKGDSVDYSENVVDGAYESCVLKGNTKVNLIQESSSQDVVLPYEFTEGQSVTIDDTKESGAVGVELKGQTLVNSFITSYYQHGGMWGIIFFKSELMAKGKKYVIVLQHLPKNCQWAVTNYDGSVMLLNYTEQLRGVFTSSLNGFEDTFALHINDGKTIRSLEELQKVKPMLIEYQDGMENWDIPYFEGMQSVQAPSVTTVGKNILAPHLLNHNILNSVKNYSGFDFTYNSDGTFTVNGTNTVEVTLHCKSEEFIKLLVDGETYSVPEGMLIETIYNDGTPPKWTRTSRYEKNRVVRFSPYFQWMKGATLSNKKFYPMVEVGSVSTTYEPYKSTTLTTPEEITLRGIGNVKDTLNLQTGEYTQRIGEVVLDGNTSVEGLGNELDNTIYFYVNNSYTLAKNKYNCPALANAIVFELEDLTGTSVDHQCMHFTSKGHLQIRLLKTSLSEVSVNGIKQYLQANPITVQYELKTPIVTKVSLTFTNQDNQPATKLSTYNTTTHINASSQEGSLLPILSHVNPSYPVILKPSTKYSIVANSYSNDHTNSAINFNLGGATTSTTVGNRVTTVTTPSTLASDKLVMSGRGNKLNNVMVIEGDVAGDEPYFEGMCDSKSPILSNVGKNLFDINGDINQKLNYMTGGGGNVVLSENSFRADSYSYDHHGKGVILNLKPNTTYTISGYVENAGNVCFYTGNWEPRHRIYNVRGYFKTTYTPAEGETETCLTFVTFSTSTDPKAIFSNILLEESSSATSYEPYKSNILSCNGDKIELTQDMFEQGSLFYENNTFEQAKSFANDDTGTRSIRIRTKKLIKVKPNTTYRFSYKNSCQSWFYGYDMNENPTNSKSTVVGATEQVFTTNASTHYIALVLFKTGNPTITPSNYDYKSIQIAEVDKTIVLRSLPNGVCDTLDLMTGEYVQRIGEVMFDGSEDEGWFIAVENDNLKTFRKTHTFRTIIGNDEIPNFVCDKLKLTTTLKVWAGYRIIPDNPIELSRGTNADDGFDIIVDCSRMTSINNLDTFRQYLSQNPVTVQYELATPIVSTIDAQGFPFSYENGHVILSSGSIEQSLTPKVEYSVPTNRNGQIRSNQKMVEKHQKELDKLQAIILANLVNSQYNQTLTTLNYELSRV